MTNQQLVDRVRARLATPTRAARRVPAPAATVSPAAWPWWKTSDADRAYIKRVLDFGPAAAR
jgi:hypothetical protein